MPPKMPAVVVVRVRVVLKLLEFPHVTLQVLQLDQSVCTQLTGAMLQRVIDVPSFKATSLVLGRKATAVIVSVRSMAGAKNEPELLNNRAFPSVAPANMRPLESNVPQLNSVPEANSRDFPPEIGTNFSEKPVPTSTLVPSGDRATLLTESANVTEVTFTPAGVRMSTCRARPTA